jgi:putative ABC transport system permease protein
MLTVNGAFQNQMDAVKTRVGTDITVRPAGSFALLGGGEPIQNEDIDKISSLPHVVSVQKTAQSFYTGNSLESSINAGRLGRRATNWLGSQFSKLPIITIGFEPSETSPILLGGARATIIQGRYFNLDESDADVAILGEALATKNGLDVGSIININGSELAVIGIFTSGQAFGDSILVMPFTTVTRLFELTGATSVTVEADNVENVRLVADSISQTLGTENVDVVTSEDTYNRISASMANASQTSEIAMIVCFIVAAAIILFSVFLSVRQRMKEIGIMKAIGASNFSVGLQFGIESFGISLIAVLLGSLIAFPLAKRIGTLLIFSTGGQSERLLGSAITRFTFVGTQLAISPILFVYALITAIVLAVLGSMLSSWYVGRVKPAEVLRNE